jgi:hypothetical protein
MFFVKIAWRSETFQNYGGNGGMKKVRLGTNLA